MIRKVRERYGEVVEGVGITDALITWYNSGEMWWWNGGTIDRLSFLNVQIAPGA